MLAQQGNRGLTHRAVDREAGLPEGSSLGLLPHPRGPAPRPGGRRRGRLAADVAALGARLASCPGDHERAVAEVSRLFSRWLDEPELLAAQLELSVAATRNPAVAERFTQWRDDLVRTVRGVMEAAGRTGARSAETLVASLDGVLLASLAAPPAASSCLRQRERRAAAVGARTQPCADLSPVPH